MTCLHNHDQILEFLRKIFLKGFQIYQNYLCALIYWSRGAGGQDLRKTKFAKFSGKWLFRDTYDAYMAFTGSP